MKLTFRLRPARSLSRAEAMGCLTANLALPGAGSLAAGRPVGYAQLALTVIGFIFTLATTAGALRWFLLTGGQSSNPDPFAGLEDLWTHVRWPLLGMAIFLAALVWALITSWQILDTQKDSVPPRIS